jgi:hypothetical protein
MRFVIIAVITLAARQLPAQQYATVDMLVPDKAIKVSPLHLLNFYPTIEASYEQKIRDKITAQLEVGYVLRYNDQQEFQKMRGVKLKAEPRYYFWGRTDRQKLYYAAIEPYANVINFDRLDSRTECFDLECNHTLTGIIATR